MRVKQLSVFLENKCGHLSRVAQVLSDAEVNILALSLVDSHDYGILHLIVNDAVKAASVLQASDFAYKMNEVTAVEVPDRPGSLTAVLSCLADKRINVEYMYAFSKGQTGRATLVLRLDDPAGAEKHLTAAGIDMLGQADLK